MNFSRIARQLNETNDPSVAAAKSTEEKATLGGQTQHTKTNESKGRQKAGMAQTMNTPKKSDVSYASEQVRAEREYIKMMEAAKSDWRQDIQESMGDEAPDHPFVDVMPFMNQKQDEVKKQMKAAAKLEGGRQAKMAEETLNELNRLEKEQGKKSGGLSDAAFRLVAKQLRNMQGTPKGQQKKQRGKKPPVAGEYGGGTSPAQRLSLKRRRKQDSIDQQTSRFD